MPFLHENVKKTWATHSPHETPAALGFRTENTSVGNVGSVFNRGYVGGVAIIRKYLSAFPPILACVDGAQSPIYWYFDWYIDTKYPLKRLCRSAV